MAPAHSRKPQNYTNILARTPGLPLLDITQPASPSAVDSLCTKSSRGPASMLFPRLSARDCSFQFISSDWYQLLCWSCPPQWDRTPTSLTRSRRGSR